MAEQWELLKDLPEAPAGAVGEFEMGGWWFGDFEADEQYMEKHPDFFRKVEAKPAPFEDVEIEPYNGKLVCTLPEWIKSISAGNSYIPIGYLPRFPEFVGYVFVSSTGMTIVRAASRMYEAETGTLWYCWEEGRKAVLPSFARFRRGE